MRSIPAPMYASLLGGVLAAACGGGDGGSFTEFVVPAGAPAAIVAGPDGAMWFTEMGGIGKITSDGSITEYPLPTGTPRDISVGPDGNIWFTVSSDPLLSGANGPGNMIGRLGIADSVVMEYPTGIDGADPYGVTAGSDGNVWFTDRAGNNVGHMSQSGSGVATVPVPRQHPSGIVHGRDGNLWVSMADGVGRLSPSSLELALFGQKSSDALAAGADGSIWFSFNDIGGGKSAIGRVSPVGDVVFFDLPDSMFALGMTAGPDGGIWFAAGFGFGADPTLGDRIGRMTSNGTVTSYSIPSPDGAPAGIAASLDGSLWFTENAANKIGRFRLH